MAWGVGDSGLGVGCGSSVGYMYIHGNPLYGTASRVRSATQHKTAFPIPTPTHSYTPPRTYLLPRPAGRGHRRGQPALPGWAFLLLLPPAPAPAPAPLIMVMVITVCPPLVPTGEQPPVAAPGAGGVAAVRSGGESEMKRSVSPSGGRLGRQ